MKKTTHSSVSSVLGVSPAVRIMTGQTSQTRQHRPAAVAARPVSSQTRHVGWPFQVQPTRWSTRWSTWQNNTQHQTERNEKQPCFYIESAREVITANNTLQRETKEKKDSSLGHSAYRDAQLHRAIAIYRLQSTMKAQRYGSSDWGADLETSGEDGLLGLGHNVVRADRRGAVERGERDLLGGTHGVAQSGRAARDAALAVEFVGLDL